MTRTFIALEMNQEIQRHLEETIRQVAKVLPGLRWVDPVGIHLTLAFLGELSDERLAEVAKAAEATAQQVNVFTYRLTRLGLFGSVRNPRVIWMGIEEPSGTLLHLHRILNQSLEQRGFEIESRPFSPHLTLARIKAPLTPDEQRQLQLLLINGPNGIASEMSYPGRLIHVMKSELSRSGASYTNLYQYALRKA